MNALLPLAVIAAQKSERRRVSGAVALTGICISDVGCPPFAVSRFCFEVCNPLTALPEVL